jgi:hypothetical protein
MLDYARGMHPRLETMDGSSHLALSGSVRSGGSVVPGTRTEHLPFPCHPKRRQAILADFALATPSQFWEQSCDPEQVCGRQFRFEHRGRQLMWIPINGLSDPISPSAMPIDPSMVAARLVREMAAG